MPPEIWKTLSNRKKYKLKRHVHIHTYNQAKQNKIENVLYYTILAKRFMEQDKYYISTILHVLLYRMHKMYFYFYQRIIALYSNDFSQCYNTTKLFCFFKKKPSY